MKGRFSEMAASIASTSPSPTPMPKEPPRKSNGCTATITGKPAMVPRAALKASGREVFPRAAFSSSAYFLSPRKCSGSAPTVGGFSSEKLLASKVKAKRSAGPMRM